ncbi:MAG: RNA polymerase sigma-54 factor [Candidatus Zixiibacteriota bacterium]|nr:MAG: RNA polymerase sigma-54 factor [candidate division Zixibacteria bacterium]
MKVGLQQRLTQSLTLAPQLIQSLKMVQAPVLKLEQMLRLELSTNPLLEEIEDTEEKTDEDEQENTEEDQDEQVDWDEYLFDDEEGYKVKEPRDREETKFEGSAAQIESLYDHLSQQLSCQKLTEEQHLIGEYVIGNVDTHGYLTISVAEMASELKIEESLIAEVLEVIQKFDPTGVGARDLRESLMIQMREKNQEKSLAYRIVSEHIQDLERKSTIQIAKMMAVPFEKAHRAMELIKGLSPTPTHGRFDAAAMPVAPDLSVEKVGDRYEVFLNDKNVPRLRIAAGYKSLIKRGSSTPKGTKDYVRSKLEQARWLLNALNQRRTTMIRVMTAIVEEQREFFDKGKAFLKPLIMEDIAQIVGMNVATISRVANGKYVQTPMGVYEVKYFFNTGISRRDGEDISKRSVKQRISDIIEKEDPAKPFSDQEIFRKLNDEGIKLARRTVTKYREELGLKSARFRKIVV